MRSHAISKKYLSFTTVQVLENASGTRSGTESLPKVFLHDNCEQISFNIFFAFLKKEEMRSGTHFTQQNVFLLFTVVVTKHVWPYFQSRFRKTSSKRVSSLIQDFISSQAKEDCHHLTASRRERAPLRASFKACSMLIHNAPSACVL